MKQDKSKAASRGSTGASGAGESTVGKSTLAIEPGALVKTTRKTNAIAMGDLTGKNVSVLEAGRFGRVRKTGEFDPPVKGSPNHELGVMTSRMLGVTPDTCAEIVEADWIGGNEPVTGTVAQTAVEPTAELGEALAQLGGMMHKRALITVAEQSFTAANAAIVDRLEPLMRDEGATASIEIGLSVKPPTGYFGAFRMSASLERDAKGYKLGGQLALEGGVRTLNLVELFAKVGGFIGFESHGGDLGEAFQLLWYYVHERANAIVRGFGNYFMDGKTADGVKAEIGDADYVEATAGVYGEVGMGLGTTESSTEGNVTTRDHKTRGSLGAGVKYTHHDRIDQSGMSSSDDLTFTGKLSVDNFSGSISATFGASESLAINGSLELPESTQTQLATTLAWLGASVVGEGVAILRGVAKEADFLRILRALELGVPRQFWEGCAAKLPLARGNSSLKSMLDLTITVEAGKLGVKLAFAQDFTLGDEDAIALKGTRGQVLGTWPG